MKNKLIVAISLTVMLISGNSIYADTKTKIQHNISNNNNDYVETPSYIGNYVTVSKISKDLIETIIKDNSNSENIINYIISEETLVYDKNGNKKSLSDIQKGSSITIYTSSYSPTPLIFPPQYQADIIIIDELNSSSIILNNVDTYFENNDMLVNASNKLALNINKDINIVDKENNEVNVDILKNKDLLVFYTYSTKSIPAQTTPIKIILLGENKTALTNIASKTEQKENSIKYSDVKKISVGSKEITNMFIKDGTLMVPIRDIAEALKMTVEWNNETHSILINKGIYTIRIDENSYIKGKMIPVQLSEAPILKDNITYVPIEYFTEIQELIVNIDTSDTSRLYLYLAE